MKAAELSERFRKTTEDIENLHYECLKLKFENDALKILMHRMIVTHGNQTNKGIFLSKEQVEEIYNTKYFLASDLKIMTKQEQS